MVLTEEQLVEAENQIIELLERSPTPYPPLQLIQELTSDHMTEYVIRAAIWYLIDRNEIELTWNRQLQRLHPQSIGTRSDHLASV